MSQKKKREFPTAFTVLFIILILAAILTYIVPSGKFSRLTYDESTRDFIITDHNDETKAIPATQEVLNDLHIQLDLSKFEDGTIKKPIAIPGTYVQIEQQPQGVVDVIKSPIIGVMDSVDIMIFVLILGGIIGRNYSAINKN